MRQSVLAVVIAIAATAGVNVGALGASPDPTPIAMEDGDPWIVYHWAYDPDGDGQMGHGVFLVRPDGRDRHLVLTAAAGFPDWSPDGKRLAVEAEPLGGVPEIWVLDANGTGVTVVTCDGGPCGDVARPAWSPDGTRLAFQRAVPLEPGEVYGRIAIDVLDLATGATRAVAVTPAVDSEYLEFVGPRWSQGGTQIVFAVETYPLPPSDEGILGSSIAVVRADGSEVDAPRILTDPAMFGGSPDWSPDGQRILFSTNGLLPTSKTSNLYTIQPDGTALTQVTHFGENDARAALPTWTPDGRRITFMHIARNPDDPWGDRHIAFIDADGTDLTFIPVPGTADEQWHGAVARLRPTSVGAPRRTAQPRRGPGDLDQSSRRSASARRARTRSSGPRDP